MPVVLLIVHIFITVPYAGEYFQCEVIKNLLCCIIVHVFMRLFDISSHEIPQSFVLLEITRHILN